MEHLEPETSAPSLFFGAFVGFLIASVVAAVITIVLAVNNNDYHSPTALSLHVAVGALGVYIGYIWAARRRVSLGINKPSDEWRQFTQSWSFLALVMIVIAGFLGITTVVSFGFDELMGPPKPRR